MNLRKLAQGKPCMVRIPEVCNHNFDTTVLAHVRIAGISGMGMKSPDLIAAWACYSCHEVYDRRQSSDLPLETIQLYFLEGVIRTQYQLLKLGVIEI